MRIGLAAAMIWSAACGAAAAQEACQSPQAECGALMSRDCLTQLGAGSLAVGSADACQSQMTAYRECLASMVERCPAASRDIQQQVNVEADRLEELAKAGGLIAEPETIVEFYNNAVVYARRGDALSQRRMLERAIALGPEAGSAKVDLHQRYSQLLRAQEGMIGAREITADVARRAPNDPAAQLAAAVAQPANQREAALRALVEGPEPFAPAWYEIANLFSRDRLGDQSIEDMRAEKAALEAFAAADEAGQVYRWFLEKDVVEVWRESVRRRLAVYQNRNLEVAPVTLTAMASNDSWMVTILPSEAARSIRYRVDGGPVQETGFMDVIDQRTGAPQPRMFFNLPLGTDEAMVDVWYNDIRDVERGPFPLAFRAADAFVANTRNILENITQKWVEDRAWDGAQLVYFSHLISHRCGLSEIRYGVNGGAPDTVFPIAPCDPENPYAMADGQEIYLRFDPPVPSMTIQVVYADGQASEPRRFDF